MVVKCLRSGSCTRQTPFHPEGITITSPGPNCSGCCPSTSIVTRPARMVKISV
jgi:hypothetical protein